MPSVRKFFAVIGVPATGPIKHHGIYTSYDNAEEVAMMLSNTPVELFNGRKDAVDGAIVEFIDRESTVYSVVEAELHPDDPEM